MGRNSIKDCLRQLILAGIDVDEKSVQLASKEVLNSGIESLILLLDGQKHIWCPGRLAYFKLNSESQVMTLTVLEQFENLGVQILIKYSA